jgi:hypothetical protein
MGELWSRTPGQAIQFRGAISITDRWAGHRRKGVWHFWSAPVLWHFGGPSESGGAPPQSKTLSRRLHRTVGRDEFFSERATSPKKLLVETTCCFTNSEQFFASSTSVDRWKEFRENRKQLRCCNWIRLPYRQSPDVPVVKAGRRMAGHWHFGADDRRKPGARIFPRSALIRAIGACGNYAASAGGASKLLRKKRRMRDQKCLHGAPAF